MADKDRFSVSKFKDKIHNYGGLSRGVFYDCRIFYENQSKTFEQDETELLCKAANLPSLELETTEIKYFTHSVKVPSGRSFQPLTLTFYNTEDYRFREKFISWLDGFNGPGSNRREITKNYATIELSPRDAAHELVAKYRFISAFPISISGLQYSFENDAQIQTFDIQFQYLRPEFESFLPVISSPNLDLTSILDFERPSVTPDPLPTINTGFGMNSFPPSINPQSPGEKRRRKKFLGLF